LGPFGHPEWIQKSSHRSASGQDVWPNVRPLKQIIRPVLLGEMVQKYQKIVFSYAVLAIWATPNGTKKVYKGPHVGRTYGPMLELENRALTKSLGPFF
jgi:hypothetical protein